MGRAGGVWLLVTILLAGCWQELPVAEGPGDLASPDFPDTVVPVDFTGPGVDFEVPPELLAAIAWHESSFVSVDGDHDEHRPAHGWMGLTPTRVELAAELTGSSTESIETDIDAGLRGGAAVLASLRDTIAPDAGVTLDRRWWDVVVAWPELGEDWLDHDFARSVFATLQQGLHVQTDRGDDVVLPARRIPGLEDVAFIEPPLADGEARSTIGYPNRSRWYPAHSGNQSSRSGGVSAIRRVVLHTTEGSYNGAISWFRNDSSNVSAHYVIRKSDGEVTQMVADDRKAWHACNNNGDTIGIEHEGASSSPSTWTAAMLDSSARLTAWLVTAYDIPIDRDHIVGHGEIQPANCSGRSDPGSYFPWDDYMQLVATYAGVDSPAPSDDVGWGPLQFDTPQPGATVADPVEAVVTHPDSHIELWSGPALLVPYLFDHPARYEHTFGGDGARSLTARAYRLSGSHLATRTVQFTVGDSAPDPPPPVDPADPPADPPAPVDTDLDDVFTQSLGGPTIRFTAAAGTDVARVEYLIEGWRLPDQDGGDPWGVPGDYELTYTFNYTGPRDLEARAYDASGNLTDTISRTIVVPDAGCLGDHCLASFPATVSDTTTGGSSSFDSYSCAPGTDESGPEVVFELSVPTAGLVSASVVDGAGVDVDVHILSALDAGACLARGHTEAAAFVDAGTAFVVVDSWVSSGGTVYDGAFTLTVNHLSAQAYVARGLAAPVFADALDVFAAAWADGETDELVYSVIDLSLPSTTERLWTIDLLSGAVLWNLHVTHGEASGHPTQPELAASFSNVNGSHQSSLGLARTAETYSGSHGYSLRLDGLDSPYNDAVRDRAIVIHGASYARPEFAASNGYLGRSWGCPAVDDRVAGAFIDDIKGGTLLLSWYPDGQWSDNSVWLP